jgi:hypothetical protein
VAAELLAGPRGRRPDLGGERISRQTRQSIRRRLLMRDSIKDRFVPDPAALGRPIVSFALAQPFAESLAAATSSWKSEAGAVDIWAFGDCLFGVFFSSNREDSSLLRARLFKPGKDHTEFFLNCDSRKPMVPVFFDFEAAWTQVNELHGTVAYPQALPSARPLGGVPPPTLSKADRDALCRILGRQNSGGHAPSSTGLVHQLREGSRERRLHQRGLGQFRTFLDPGACCRWAGNFPEAITFVRGDLVNVKTSPELFHHLVAECKISPFLFATDEATVLFACLARSGSMSTDLSSQPPALIPPTIQSFLRQVVVLREPLGQLSPLVDHRYDRPFMESLCEP